MSSVPLLSFLINDNNPWQMVLWWFVLKRKRDLFITGIFPATNLFFITVLNKFQKVAAGENYSHYSFILIPKQLACNASKL